MPSADMPKALRPSEWLVLGVNDLCSMHCPMCDVGLANVDTTCDTNLMGSQPVNMPPPCSSGSSITR